MFSIGSVSKVWHQLSELHISKLSCYLCVCVSLCFVPTEVAVQTDQQAVEAALCVLWCDPGADWSRHRTVVHHESQQVLPGVTHIKTNT